jgi:hypothetical protein
VAKKNEVEDGRHGDGTRTNMYDELLLLAQAVQCKHSWYENRAALGSEIAQ